MSWGTLSYGEGRGDFERCYTGMMLPTWRCYNFSAGQCVISISRRSIDSYHIGARRLEVPDAHCVLRADHVYNRGLMLRIIRNSGVSLVLVEYLQRRNTSWHMTRIFLLVPIFFTQVLTTFPFIVYGICYAFWILIPPQNQNWVVAIFSIHNAL